MFTNPLSKEFALELYADNIIVDYDTHLAGTDQEVTKVMSHGGKVADLIDDSGIISYSIYSSEQAYVNGEYDHIGAIADADDRAEFLSLFK
ncbi:hypothetical protein QP892_03780 [Corynebacterium pseudodiphtheriticum]|uniref:hypothetical protein n=1 Tax=Corynebacterium pseudodiphtheriticum TaxID=37637 RepID=UPI00254A5DF9|nr:hypothetical protein [Corynebacterium pseudodiphtheriticum]MDK8717638.1 hypothetical protein [Corynebacterium pseudodiphtheriticum]